MDGYAYRSSAAPSIPTRSEAWRDSPLSGDPYSEAPVYRGGSFSGGFQGFDRGGGPLFGASELVADTCWKDCTSYGEVYAPLPEQFAYHSPAIGAQLADGPAVSEAHAALTQEFLPDDEPPVLPQNPFFQLVATTLHIAPKHSFELGNHLLSFLRDELKISAEAVKFRRAKFTAKAEVLPQQCTVKFRVYRVAGKLLAVELQRRRGDAVDFADIFKLFMTYLAERYELAEGLPTALPQDLAFAQHPCASGMQLGVPRTGA